MLPKDKDYWGALILYGKKQYYLKNQSEKINTIN